VKVSVDDGASASSEREPTKKNGRLTARASARRKHLPPFYYQPERFLGPHSSRQRFGQQPARVGAAVEGAQVGVPNARRHEPPGGFERGGVGVRFVGRPPGGFGGLGGDVVWVVPLGDKHGPHAQNAHPYIGSRFFLNARHCLKQRAWITRLQSESQSG
jgi:hypothetical protein